MRNAQLRKASQLATFNSQLYYVFLAFCTFETEFSFFTF